MDPPQQESATQNKAQSAIIAQVAEWAKEERQKTNKTLLQPGVEEFNKDEMAQDLHADVGNLVGPAVGAVSVRPRQVFAHTI